MSRRAGLYLRISQDRHEDYLAVDRQREDGERLIAQRGWTQVDTYVDNDVTASGRKRRPEFERLLADVVADRIDAIVVSEMPRLSRNRRDDLQIVETCQPRQAIIAVVRGSDIDLGTAAGRLTADILAAAARHEIEQKSERQRRQVEQAIAAGKPGTGSRPFGFLDDRVTHHPVEAALVAEMYERWLAGAMLQEIASWLNELGVTTPKGSRWKHKTVSFVLRNPRYAGIRGVREVVDEAKGTRSEWHTERARGCWAPIVPEPVWRAALARLKQGRRVDSPGGLGPYPKYLLTGIATCGVCGSPVHCSYTGKRAWYARAYCCSAGSHVVRAAEPIELYVETWMVRGLCEPDAARLLRPSAPRVNVDAARHELLTIEHHLSQLGMDLASGLMERATVLEATQRLRTRRTELEEQLAAAGRVDALAPLVLAQGMTETRRLWRGFPLSTRRALIRRTMTVVIKRGRVGRPRAGAGFDPDTMDIAWRDE